MDHWRAFQRPEMAQVFNYTDVEVLELMQLLRNGDRSVILSQEVTDEAAPLGETLTDADLINEPLARTEETTLSDPLNRGWVSSSRNVAGE